MFVPEATADLLKNARAYASAIMDYKTVYSRGGGRTHESQGKRVLNSGDGNVKMIE